METKFHKKFGQVEVLSQDDNITIVKIVATGEEKKLMTKFVTLSDSPIEQQSNNIVVRDFSKKTKFEKKLAAERRYNSMTAAQRARLDREHATFCNKMNMAVLKENFTDEQITTGNYNINLIR